MCKNSRICPNSKWAKLCRNFITCEIEEFAQFQYGLEAPNDIGKARGPEEEVEMTMCRKGRAQRWQPEDKEDDKTQTKAIVKMARPTQG